MKSGFIFMYGTNMATGEKVMINVGYIESIQSFFLDGEEHCFVNLVSGRQFKCAESQETLEKEIKEAIR